MRKLIVLSFLALTSFSFVANSARATDVSLNDGIILPGESVDLKEFLWIKRPIVVFADNASDPRYIEQMNFITDRLDDLDRRDVVVLTDTDPSADSDLRRTLRPRGFMLALIGKDGKVELRKPAPWSVRELSRAIDKMPIRQQEIRDRLSGN
ncbi:DUF4174 domain-containing protein [Roseovarius sp. SK2]|jgi:hypothetical protein|uniref:DUF4174 domain-containing protein n=1 Tax=Roseovarius TaxID=74030 RepID=UPI000CDD732E|nr:MULTISPECIES: DUF4174 domain-containing protein [Roseovarius]MDD9726237.1 DUF4174 domain-containing protein [Roseovarius sp. SK2]